MSTATTSATAAAAATIAVLDPATGEQLDTIPAGDEQAADAAVRAAAAAQPAWARTAPGERAAVLKAAARGLRGHGVAEELAVLQTRENGRPLAESRAGVEAGIGAIEQYAELGPLHRGRALQGEWNATDLMVHEPRGVVALLVPWNDPLAIACGQLAACLVAGNTVVLKPSEKTPLATIRLLELLDLPAGIVQLLLGDARAGRRLAAHPLTDLVVHTGSVTTGRELASARGGELRKALLELGGKDPLIVDAGVDPVWAAGQAALGAFANAGQLCTSVERIYVHAQVADRFTQALVEAARALRPGPGLDPASTMGPLIDERQRGVVDAHVRQAIEAGAERLTGGAPAEGHGFFYPPTVLRGARDDMDVMREETFGPVAAIRTVTSFDEALEAANGTVYGLAATVLTGDLARAQRASCASGRSRSTRSGAARPAARRSRPGPAGPVSAMGRSSSTRSRARRSCTSNPRPRRKRAPHHSTRSRRGLGISRRPAFASGRPSTRTMSAVKSLEPRSSDEPTP